MIVESLGHLTNEIMDEPEVVRVNEKNLRHGKLLEVRATLVDLGQVIDHDGRAIKALCCVAIMLSTNGSI